jgi:hypothetical protein
VDLYLKEFCRLWLGVVACTLCVVSFVAFFSMPLALGFHPGEAFNRVAPADMHMS